MKKYLSILFLVIFCENFYAQKKIICDGFQKNPIGKYIVTNESIIDTLGNIVYESKYGGFNLYSKIITGNLLFEHNKEKNIYRILNLKTKKAITDFEIKSYKVFNNGYSIIQIDKVTEFNNENKNYFFIDANGQKLCHFPKNAKTLMGISNNGSFKEGLAKIQFHSDLFYGQHWGFGFIDKKGNIVIEPKYKDAHSFHEGLAAVLSKNDKGIFKWGFINKKNEKIIDFKYTRQPSSFCEGMAIVENKNGKKGFINLKGEVIIEPIYDYTTGFYKDFAIVKKDYKTPYELIDKVGKTIHTFTKIKKFIYFNELNNNSQKNGFIKNFIDENAAIALLHATPKPTVVDFDENILFENETYAPFNSYKSGLSYRISRDKVTKSKKVGFINKKGEFVIIKAQNQF